MPRLIALVTLLIALAATQSAARQVALGGHTDAVHLVAFLPDGKTLLSSSADRTVRLWDVPDGHARSIWQQVPEFDAAASTTIIAVSADGSFIVRAGKVQGSIEIWDVAKVARVRTIPAHQDVVRMVALSHDGSLLITATDEEARTWDLATGKAVARYAAPHLYRIAAVAAAPNGGTFAVATTDRALGIYSAGTGEPVMKFDGVPGQVKALAFSPDGKHLASGEEGPTEDSVRLWDVTQPAAAQRVIGPPNYASAVAFSPDGRRLAAAGVIVKVWDIDAQQLTHTFEGHTATVRSLAFSPDSALLASGSDDHVIGLWTLNK